MIAAVSGLEWALFAGGLVTSLFFVFLIVCSGPTGDVRCSWSLLCRCSLWGGAAIYGFTLAEHVFA